MKYSLVSTFALLVLGSAALGAEETVLRIGDKAISVRQFEAMAQKLRETGYSHVEKPDQQGKQELLDGVIARELLIAEGLRRGYDRESSIAQAVAKSERKALMNKLYEQEAVQASYAFTEEELRAFFARQQYDAEVLSQHIVCATEEEARLVLELLGEGTPFESLVRPYSLQNIQQRFGPGGWVGWFKVGEVYEELKVPLGTMPVGSVYPDPVQTLSGYTSSGLGNDAPSILPRPASGLRKRPACRAGPTIWSATSVLCASGISSRWTRRFLPRCSLFRGNRRSGMEGTRRCSLGVEANSWRESTSP